ncbi:PIG-L family deacetylase [Microbacterium hatanonis]|uniref:PIG-L family deacetylase n=1 Tax=Microbacterium hatanonis TaxID=404366 RepID=A0A5C8I315_9MICO|nr:PIG-L family deacetylase [Microbacterium hatanonis]TXK13156.1 hypothetical protein FVP77_06970 [Microbacterium hatanonis]
MRHRGKRGLSALGFVFIAAATVLGLAGCAAVSATELAPTTAPSVSSVSNATPTPTPTATPTIAPTPTPTPPPTATAEPEPPAPPPVDPLRPACAGARAMSVWAHEDDDLLFAGTQLPQVLAAGGCIRTVFLTDGDAGRGSDYARGRVEGIHRAYDVLRGASSPWTETEVTLPSGATVSVHQPVDDTRVSLVFLHLPDGNLNGQGYPATGEVSLAKLAANKIAALPPSTGGAPLSWSAIVASLDDLIGAYQPASFFTHVPGSANTLAKGDHADHAITGIIARKAWFSDVRGGATIMYAMGYQSAQRPANLSGDVLRHKIAVFRTYAADDPVIRGCSDDASCLAVPRFGGWLGREYLFTEAQLGLG